MELETEIVFVVLLFIVLAISGSVLYYPVPIAAFFAAHGAFFAGIVRSIFDFLIVISFPVSLILLIGIIVSIERLKVIRRKEHAIYNVPEGAHAAEDGTATPAALTPKSGAKGSPETTNRWRKIVELVDSSNQNDWKQAIIDADSILDEMLSRMSYHGDDLGSKLRGATKADFKTLDQAWDAHKVRNDIAHGGSNFLLSQHEAKRVIHLYRQVFEEFFYI